MDWPSFFKAGTTIWTVNVLNSVLILFISPSLSKGIIYHCPNWGSIGLGVTSVFLKTFVNLSNILLWTSSSTFSLDILTDLDIAHLKYHHILLETETGCSVAIHHHHMVADLCHSCFRPAPQPFYFVNSRVFAWRGRGDENTVISGGAGRRFFSLNFAPRPRRFIS
jgi:hypothetical protein